MWAVDENTAERYFNRDVYVDGSPAVADVYLNGEWKTVLVCGQGPGTGSVAGGGKNFYFALDVTNPANPLPLWELTDVATMGETWSVPVIGKVTKTGSDKWVAFMGSGYDNNTDLGMVLGHVLYAVDLETGIIFWSFASPEVDTSASPANNNVNIQNTMPGSPSIIDANIDGYADRVYIGDLDGRIWKVDLSTSFVDAASWSAEQIYEDPDNYPIITKPALWKSPNMLMAEPRLYFGTGGDDMAPNTVTYSFVALIDKEPAAEVEWFLGNPDTEGVRTSEKDVGDFGVGEKVWADPKIADQTVYCSTLTGSIESVDLCSNLAGLGKLYARFVASIAGSAVGGTALRSPTGPVESLNLAIKTRSAVTIGETSTAEGGVKKREVYIQEYNSTVQRLEQLTGGLLKIKSWREVYSIYKR
jgi:Tfp pilus tip-associated adhesin PilY1